MHYIVRKHLLLVMEISLLTVCAMPFVAAEVTFHPKLEILDFKSPGRVALLQDKKFGCVDKGHYLLTSDNGKSWQQVGKIPRGDGPAVSDGILVESRDRHLVFVYRDMKNYHLDRTENNMPLPGANLDVWSVRSTDRGRTWESPQQLLDGYCGAIIGGVCTENNRVVFPLQDLRYEPPRHVTVVYMSKDNGATWETNPDLDIGGYGLEDGAFEGTVAQRADDSLLLYMRTSRDRLWWSESPDGLEWTLPTPTDIKASNSPAFLLALQSGRLALAWNQLYPEGAGDWPRRVKTRYAERPDNVFREELSLSFSDDDGKTWMPPIVIAREPGGRLRYAYMLERRPGEIWLQVKGQWLKIHENDFVDAEP